ncbi:hypothetical protein MAPG_03808 [Magnaporthiopsis poae ATCC 64411]|uniref:Bacteriocin-protection protein n=1 Tax=Magnaporthiopsis poae (strain ATCC 64411 / 73-15) TaxID=644358 RepID=A0A0C4DV09_MAGP6|nr:hypothetical protein MAPG_03808 [Magnaporthiopsis poae ATCC 64411]
MLALSRWQRYQPGRGNFFLTLSRRLGRPLLRPPSMPPETRRTRSAVSAASQKAKALAATIASSPAVTATPPPDEAATVNSTSGSGGGSSSSSSSSSPPIVLFENAQAFETWLEGNPDDTAGLWLKFAKKGCDTPTVTYNEALDVALCFGWIDSQVRPLDARFCLRRFTPRRPRSLWSKRNVAKVAALVAAGRMRPRGQAEVDAAVRDGRWERAYSSGSTVEVPADFRAALDADDRGAAEFFAGLNKTQRCAMVVRIEMVKKEETRRRKIGQLVDMLARRETL